MDNRENIIEKVRAYKDLVTNFFPIKIEQFWLFGSYAKGNPHKDSDIDIALVVEHLDDDYNFLETEPILWRLREAIDFRIEPHIIAKDEDYSDFLKEIQRTGIVIND
ncbi:MAG: nucleotidyltransferase domain-containing protein [Bacteroidales bacterium]|jgi:predicted nucleotidyltransferase|nr:nucleotidyltransferase domain-containing protein [Bacteroidales bacterium]